MEEGKGSTLDRVVVNSVESHSVNTIPFYNVSIGAPVACPGYFRLSAASLFDRILHSLFAKSHLVKAGHHALLVDAPDRRQVVKFVCTPEANRLFERLVESRVSEFYIAKKYFVAKIEATRNTPEGAKLAYLKSSVAKLADKIPEHLPASRPGKRIREEKFDNAFLWLSIALVFIGLPLFMFAMPVKTNGNPQLLVEAMKFGAPLWAVFLLGLILFKKLCGHSARLKKGFSRGAVLMASGFFFLPGSALWVYGLNQSLDSSVAESHVSSVIDVRPKTEDTGTFEVQVEPFPGALESPLTIEVTEAQAKKISLGKTAAVLQYRSGAFGIRWLSKYRWETE